MIRREISGPQTQFERSGASFRDVRPTTVRLSEALRSSGSGILLAGVAAATWFYPILVDFTVPASLLYAGWVMSRRVVLPLRLPRSARRKDWNYPDPDTRKPREAAGDFFLGYCVLSGQQLWLTHDDLRQHVALPGTTGAGKTSTILSMLANALAQGSGFVLVDGKADNKLYGEVMALARRFGREDDVSVLNFLVASGVKDSSSFNPFAAGNADAIRELLASQLGEQTANDANGIFRGRAIALLGTMAPILVYMRDVMGIPLNIERIRFAMELKGIWMLAMQKRFLLRDSKTGDVTEVPVPDMPEDLVYPLRAYLGELPGYDLSVPYNEQKGSEPAEQHGFALFYFTATFTQMTVSLGHIFKVETGDVDMRDIVLNRRILVVNLPSLENSDDTLAALGKIVVASLRGMMAQLLGARLEGESKEIFALKPGSGDAPFHVVFDEIAYYATSGMDRMLAMGRGLNMSFWLGFQELAGMWARLGDKTDSLLGNANTTIALRQQDANRTRTWLEKTAGTTEVTQATTYHGGAVGEYREAQHAEVRQVSRIDWNDLQRLLEGEAIILFGGRRIYTKAFYAKLDISGYVRRNRPIMLPAPNPKEILTAIAATKNVVDTLLSGHAAIGDEPESDILKSMRLAFEQGLKQKKPFAESAKGAIEAAGAAYHRQIQEGQRDPAGGPNAEPPVTAFLSMLEAAASEIPVAFSDLNLSVGHVDPEVFQILTAVETMATGNAQAGRKNAIRILAECCQALAEKPAAARPPAMPAPDLAALIAKISDRIAA